MRLVVGLGNPGRTYALTRHNFGFLVVDTFAQRQGLAFTRQKFKAKIASGIIQGEQVLLAKPQTFMNLSGEAVAPLVRFYDLPLSQVLLVYDDIDLPFGKLRLRDSGSSGGHKGMQSIIAALGTSCIPRLRLGIRGEKAGGDLRAYVLQPFSKEESADLPELREKASQAIEAVLTEPFEKAMNQFN
ncbi:MAG: aminoacyl-tRNA hydrolase [Candidatus Abyssobacteria bacterium SURF_5]|uniref:Peptidyl-tRNA hydrolase n=1 Tax=Abyssobacteria bacterium (strain SURF_5) TaxID=2093360 RepID=A0A3A4PD91_ABYX5|nr:MAG: aminoacyl-tRNA hydrolase [Candidatus Abyssubacteria bacterium SURF_5]